MFGEEKIMKMEHELLKEKHEFLKKEYESLEMANKHLVEECERERKRSEKDKYKKIVEEMKKKKSEMIDELKKKDMELLLARESEEEELERIMNKYVELAGRLSFVEGESAYLRSLYNAQVAVSGTPSAVISEIDECDHLIGQGENEVNQNVNNNNNATTGDGTNSSIENRASGETITPMAVNHPPLFPASSSASS